MSIFTGVGSPGTLSVASGGSPLAFNNISTTPQQVLGGVAARRKITFHNPGTVDIFIAPVTVAGANGSDTPLTPTTIALGGCLRVYANGGTLEISGECQKPWQALAASGSTNPLTILVSNI
jgi:hypothetical protein